MLSWEFPKIAPQFAIDRFGEPGSLLEKLFGGIDIEPLIGAQEGEKVFEAAVDADLLDDRLHFAANALDLA